MASIHGFMDGSFDYKHMYNIKDLHGPLPIPAIRPGTLFSLLKRSENNCVQFTSLLETLPMVGLYNDPQAQHTLFAPITVDVAYINSLDDYKRKQLILYHTLSKPLTIQFITSSKGMLLPTLQNGSSICISKNSKGETLLNGYSKIVGSIQTGRNTLVLIDKMLFIDNNPLSNVNI